MKTGYIMKEMLNGLSAFEIVIFENDEPLACRHIYGNDPDEALTRACWLNHDFSIAAESCHFVKYLC